MVSVIRQAPAPTITLGSGGTATLKIQPGVFGIALPPGYNGALGVLRYDVNQAATLTGPQQAQARSNINVDAAGTAAALVATEQARAQGVEATLPSTYAPVFMPAYVATKARANGRTPENGVYNRKAATMRRLRGGLGRAAAGGHSAHVVIGTSLSAGCTQGLTAPYSGDKLNAWPLKMRNVLSSEGRIPICGTGWVMTNDGAILTDPRWTFTGATWTTAGINYRSCNATDYATYTPDMGGSHLSLWIYDGGAGAGTYAFSVYLNGTFVTTLSSIAGVTAGLNLRTIIMKHSAGDQIKIVAGANGMLIGGARTWSPGQGGIEVHNIAQSSSKASGNGARSWSDMVAAGALGTDWIDSGGVARTVNDGVLNAGSNVLGSASSNFTDASIGRQVFLPAGGGIFNLNNNTAYITGIVDATHVTLSQNASTNVVGQTVQIGTNPDVVHIELGYNDLQVTNRATTIAAITTIAQHFPNSDIWLHVFAAPDPSIILGATFDGFASDLYDLADTLGCVLMDHRDRQGIHTDLEAVHFTGDNIAHQNTAAHFATGRAVALALAA